MIGRIAGTGAYAPLECMDNDDLSRLVDTSDQWIRERTGIVKRHIAGEETTSFMAAEAGRQAMENAGIAPEEIDLIIVGTFSSDVLLPCTACEVQRELGAVRAVCFDLNAACTGFLFAYNTAQAYLLAGIYKTALIIGAESLSKVVDWKDRTTCILFGDGAGAAVLKAEEEGCFFSTAYSDGSRKEALTCQSRNAYIKMDGRKVFEFAVKKVPESILEVLEKAQLPIEKVEYFLLHQANQRIVESAARRLKTDIQKFPMNIRNYGNTSAASIPLLLDEINKKGLLKRGDYIVLAGFGAGMSWGATLVQW